MIITELFNDTKSLNELAPGGSDGSGPFDYGSAIIKIGETFVDVFADSAAGEDAAMIMAVGETFMTQGMMPGIKALFELDTQVYDHVLDELADQGFNVEQDIIAQHRKIPRDTEAGRLFAKARAEWQAQPGDVYVVTGRWGKGSSVGQDIKASSEEEARQKFLARNPQYDFTSVDVKRRGGAAGVSEGMQPGHSQQNRAIVQSLANPAAQSRMQQHAADFDKMLSQPGYDHRPGVKPELAASRQQQRQQWIDAVKNLQHWDDPLGVIRIALNKGISVDEVLQNLPAGMDLNALREEVDSVSEAMKPSDIPPSMRDRLTMRDIERERPEGAFRFRVTFPDGAHSDFMDFEAARATADIEQGRISRLSETQVQHGRKAHSGKRSTARIDRILQMLRTRNPQAQNDLEALILDFRGQQAQDRSDIARLDAENDMEEADIARLEALLNQIRRHRTAATETAVPTHHLGETKKKPQPTNPELWSRAKSAARSKFDVYPSAYANAWAAKWYKSKGGGWRMGKPKKD